MSTVIDHDLFDETEAVIYFEHAHYPTAAFLEAEEAIEFAKCYIGINRESRIIVARPSGVAVMFYSETFSDGGRCIRNTMVDHPDPERVTK